MGITWDLGYAMWQISWMIAILRLMDQKTKSYRQPTYLIGLTIW